MADKDFVERFKAALRDVELEEIEELIRRLRTKNA